MPIVRLEDTTRVANDDEVAALVSTRPALPAAAIWGVRVAGATSAIIGGTYLVAWLGGFAVRWSAAGAITTKTNMALALVLAGSALVLLSEQRSTHRRRVAAAFASAVVLIIGVLTLSQHVFGVDLRIDQLLASELPGATATASPNRIGPPGSTSLALLGAGLLALAWKRRIASSLGVATCLVVLIPAVGFLYGVSPLYGTARTGIAWPTVIALLALGIGLVLSDTHEGRLPVIWRDDPGGVLLRQLLLPAVLIPLVFGYLRVQGERHGLYDAPMGTGLFALSLIVLFSFLLWRSAERLSAAAAERTRAADALSEREERLSVTLRSIGDAVIATDVASSITAFNAVAEELTGWKAEEAVGRPVDEVFRIIDEETRQPASNPVARVLREGVVVGLANHTALVARDGTERPIADSAAPIRDSSGKTAGVVLVFRDQEEERRKRAALLDREERLRVAMQQLESLLENSPLAVIEWTPHEFRITRWSDEATRMFGWTAQEAVGKRIDELEWVYPDDWPLVEQVMADMLNGKRPRNVSKNRNVRKDGSVIHCEWYNSTVSDSSGELASVLSLVLDVTERTRGEEALREADKRKTEFIGMLSHELRNPLAPIRNSIYLLDRAPPGGEQAARAKDIIRRQTEHLTRLVDDLLDVTRIARGKIELRRARLDVRDVVRRACEDQRSVFQGRAIELRVEVSDPVWVEGDETRLSQVIGNLLQNAAKFSQEGGLVTAGVRRVDGVAEVRVRDRGVGIGPELLPRLFEPFVQADSGLARTRGGLGLGLALVKGLVELHGGSVRASSEGAGRGSEFVVNVPLASFPAPSATAAVPQATPESLHILVIEDNVDAAASLADLLQFEGHRVHVATDGRSGIAKAREQAPNVILCDIGLPDLDGYEIARTLRADHSLRSTRLIAVSGYAQPQDKVRAEEAGFDGHIAKPASLDALLAVLAKR